MCRSPSARAPRRSRTSSCAGRSARAGALERLIYRLTVRQGPRVTREKFEDLDAAIAAMELRAKEIRSAGPLRPRKMLREFEAEAQVAGRVEVSSGGFLRRGADVGVDVMGDGTFVAFRGGVRRLELDAGHDGPFAAARRALE